MEEVEYLRAGTTLVTSTRIEIDGQTFAVRNVGSVKVDRPGKPWVASFMCLVFVVSAVQSGQWFFWLLVAAAGYWIWQQINTRSLVLVTGGGEVVALKSTKTGPVEQLREAIAKAISSR